MKFSPCQSRFDDIGNIHGAVSAIHQHLQFIHEKNDPGTMFDSFNNIPQAFFQFTPVLGACYHITQFKRENNFVT